jgi:lipoprotein NlpD
MQLYRYLCSVCMGLFLIGMLSACATKTGGRPAPVERLGSSGSGYSKPSMKSKVKSVVADSVSPAAASQKPVSEAGLASTLGKISVNSTADLVGRGAPDSKWLWPTKGEVISGFSTGSQSNKGANKGIDLAARPGEPVHATAEGKVVYSGRGLKGYGEMIILKHDSEFLSAYAHNQKLLVKEGDTVRAGQVIALAGDTDAHRVMLHFEIRKGGKPVDPLNYLPQQQ